MSFTSISLASLAYKGNHFSALVTIFQIKIPWIIDSRASNHMTDAYHLFITYSSCTKNPKIKIIDGSLSTIAGKGSIWISNSITLKYVLHVPNFSYDLISISQVTKISRCLAIVFYILLYILEPLIEDDNWQWYSVITTLMKLKWVSVVNLLIMILFLFLGIAKFYYSIIEWTSQFLVFQIVIPFIVFE